METSGALRKLSSRGSIATSANTRSNNAPKEAGDWSVREGPVTELWLRASRSTDGCQPNGTEAAAAPGFPARVAVIVWDGSAQRFARRAAMSGPLVTAEDEDE
jgi:hypothetical protein